MRKIGIAIGVAVALVALFIAVVMVASESGVEVVTLQTTALDGSIAQTRLWVVDYEGHAWLRAGVPSSGWLQRIDAEPRVRVTRGSETRDYRGAPVRDPSTRDRIHALMRDKYGSADRLVSLIRDGNASVPVRLDPAS